MSANRLNFQGLEELRAAFRQLAPELAEEGNEIVERRSDEAEQSIVVAYPEVAGDLRKGVKKKSTRSEFGTTAVLRSGAPHASIFEHGSQARHTSLGYNRGAMPPAKIFIPMVMRKRRAMFEDLVALVRRAGFEIRGAI